MKKHINIPHILDFFIKITKRDPDEQQIVIRDITPDRNTFNEQDLKDNLERVNFWIENCDQKASFILAILGVGIAAGFSVDAFKAIRNHIVGPILTAQDIPWLQIVIALFLFTAFACVIASLWMLLLSLQAKTDLSRFSQPGMQSNSMYHYETVNNRNYSSFVEDKVNVINDLRTQVYVNSIICTSKFNHYKCGVKLLQTALIPSIISVILAFFYDKRRSTE